LTIGKLFEALRARWAPPNQACARGMASRFCSGRSPALRRGGGLRALGAEFLTAAKLNPLDAPVVSEN
jgi:hypothetical protein